MMLENENNENEALKKTDVTSSVFTLEHLSIAMSNNMFLLYFDDERELLHNNCKIVELREDEMTISNGEYQYDVEFNDVQLLLKPISYLRKDEHFDAYMDLCESLDMVNCAYLLEALEKGLYYAIDIQKYYIIEQFMNKNHFDWRFNLIEKELAIEFPRPFL